MLDSTLIYRYFTLLSFSGPLQFHTGRFSYHSGLLLIIVDDTHAFICAV